jgi:3-methyladenine DNA glycosylase Tag
MPGMHWERPKILDGYLEAMSRVIFTAGISWKVVESKWPGIRDAFAGFDVEKVAAMSPDDIERLAADRRLIRNHRKIEAIVDNAAVLLELDKGPGGFAGYLKSLGDYEAKVAGLRKHFSFLGPSLAHIFLAMVGEPVPESDNCAHYSHSARRGKEPAG